MSRDRDLCGTHRREENMLCIMWLVWWLIVYTTGTSSNIVPLPDGIYMVKTEDVATVVMNYELVLLIEKPEKPIALLNAIDEVHKEVEKVMVHRTLRLIERSTWLRKLQDMKKQIKDYHIPITVHHRTRRGLLDVVGKMSKTLFGTATVEDVRRVAAAVQQSRNEDKKITHQVNQMLSVVKLTRRELNETRQRMNVIIDTVKTYAVALAVVTEKINSLSNRVREVSNSLMYEQALAQIEAGVAQYVEHQRLYHQQRNQLAAEQFTTDLMPRDELMKILHGQLEPNAVYIEPIDWYYEHCPVYTMWTGEDLVYHVSLPLISRNRFDMFKLVSFAVPVNQSSITTRVMVKDQVATDHRSGRGLRPTSCVGRNPVVCKNNIEYRDRNQCEHAIIHGLKETLSYCEVEIRSQKHCDDIQEVGNQKYVIQTTVMRVKKRCRGTASGYEQLSVEVYLLTLEKHI